MVFPPVCTHAHAQILHSLLPSYPFQPAITSAICLPPPLPIVVFFSFFFSVSTSSSSALPLLLPAPLPPQDVLLGPCFPTYTLVAFRRTWNTFSLVSQRNIRVSLTRRGGRRTVTCGDSEAFQAAYRQNKQMDIEAIYSVSVFINCRLQMNAEWLSVACILHFQPQHMNSKILLVMPFIVQQVASCVIFITVLSLHTFFGFNFILKH